MRYARDKKIADRWSALENKKAPPCEPWKAIHKVVRQRAKLIIAQPFTKRKGFQEMSRIELANKCRELKELRQMAEELAAEIATIEDEIKATMTEQGVDELSVDVYKIRWQTITSNRFDSTAFKKSYSELYQQFTKQTTSKRFTVA